MFDFIIVGAGIVGLATGVKLLESYPNCSLLILEKENSIAKHQTGNNSGVIHSGIYYKPNSLKAVNCKKGYKLLLEFCNKHNVKYDICGKLIVAANEAEIPILESIYNRGIQNGLIDIKWIEQEQIKEYEPNVAGVKALLVPSTGIIDYKEVANKYKEIIEINGGILNFNSKVIDIIQSENEILVSTTNSSFVCKKLVSCCGLHSDTVAKITNKNLDLQIIPFRGEYYTLTEEKKKLVNNLIYPVPDPAFPFLGVHFTRMIDGKVEAGPNAVLAFKKEGYKKSDFSLKDVFNIFAWKGFRKVIYKYWFKGLAEFYRSFSKKAFVKALQKLIPCINEADLFVGGAGIRAQACDSKGNLLDDFYFIENKNILHVCNAPSPAATASLAIAETIVEKIKFSD